MPAFFVFPGWVLAPSVPRHTPLSGIFRYPPAPILIFPAFYPHKSSTHLHLSAPPHVVSLQSSSRLHDHMVIHNACWENTICLSSFPHAMEPISVSVRRALGYMEVIAVRLSLDIVSGWFSPDSKMSVCMYRGRNAVLHVPVVREHGALHSLFVGRSMAKSPLM